MRRAVFALSLMVTAAVSSACSRGPTSSTSAREERPLATFEPYLTRQLTPSAARAQFGAPDAVAGSGLLIYKYGVDGGRTLWLGFPGFAPITYAKLEAPDGSMTDLALR